MSTTEKLDSDKLPLTDEQVSDVSGGAADNSSIISAWRKIAESEGRNSHIGAEDSNPYVIQCWRNASCPKCGAAESLFGRSITVTKYATMGFPMEHECEDVKCYVCGYLFGKCDLIPGSFEVYIQNWGR